MTKDQMKDRTKKFSIAAVLYYKNMAADDIKYTIGKQLLRAATSVGG